MKQVYQNYLHFTLKKVSIVIIVSITPLVEISHYIYKFKLEILYLFILRGEFLTTKLFD
jgi:hypothetical protein